MPDIFAGHASARHRCRRGHSSCGPENARTRRLARERHRTGGAGCQGERFAAPPTGIDPASCQLQGELSQKQSDVSELQGRMDEAQASFAAREKLLRESNERMKVEFESLATKVLNAQGAQQRQSLDVLLNPFREQIGDFRKRVEEVYRSDTKERASLLKEMQNLQSASDRINTEAENLTKALKGDNKIQGNWAVGAGAYSGGLRPAQGSRVLCATVQPR